MMSDAFLYKLISKKVYDENIRLYGTFKGTQSDLRNGFIHLYNVKEIEERIMNLVITEPVLLLEVDIKLLNTYSMDVSNIANGIYILTLQNENTQKVEKVIVQH